MESAARTFYLVTNNSSMIDYNDANNYLKTLFARCTQGYIEIRPIPDPGGLRQWIPLSNIVAPVVPANEDIYVGVATRQYGKGGKEYIVEIPAVWVDIDFKDIERKEVEKSIEIFGLKPSIVVESGHGLHLYWILKTPGQSGDIQKIEDVNRRLAFHFGGDQASSEAARILRLPGTYNQKYTPARRVSLSSINDNTYYIDDFNFLPQPDPPKPASSGQKQDWYTGLLEGVSEGKRQNSALRLSSRYQAKGLSESETQILLSGWNERNTPPLEKEELEKTIVYDYKRYGRGNADNQPSPDFETIIENSVISVHKFIREPFKPQPCIIDPWLRTGEIGLITAGRGIGKTWLALSIGMAATRPYTIGKWKTGIPTGCLYIDGEMAQHALQSRLRELQMGQPKEVAPFKLLSSDRLRSCGNSAPKLTDPKWRNSIFGYLKRNSDIKLLIIDNLACLTPGLDENAKRDWDDINGWLLQLRSDGVAVILIHHAGKGGEQRGTSAREDSIDVSIKLTRPVGYSSEEGAKFNVEFTKNRGLYGEAVKSFGISLKPTGNGLTWEEGPVESKKEVEIIEMLQEGEKQKDIAKELKVSPAYVSQVKKKAIQEGRLSGSVKLVNEEENQSAESTGEVEDQDQQND